MIVAGLAGAALCGTLWLADDRLAIRQREAGTFGIFALIGVVVLCAGLLLAVANSNRRERALRNLPDDYVFRAGHLMRERNISPDAAVADRRPPGQSAQDRDQSRER